ncbi:hypothetical protein PVAND_002130 [Polypedilum vanderplanki]|uniref:Nuclear pore complex protein Nup214-like n=1 Tax=Polypedilum vanderplanki TaxID=319348 RepID=A0A9J6BQL3_POLVA|nr:hypothetical protein PVAND_002130 [Polypedilum vanderplanki]
MALAGPIGNDNLNISFRLHSKNQVFDGSSNILNNARVNLVTSASSFGLVFVGSSLPEIIVLCMKDLESSNAIESNAPVRKIPMPSSVTQLACNCDGSILAVDVKINGISHIQLYSVASFLAPSVQKIREFRVSTDNSSSSQLCWNPVINSALAVCSENGSLGLYVLKDQGVEFHSIDPSLKAKCCCWSPKGKQIVAGFADGKLMQFNMEMKPARTIECPQGIINGSFDTIAIQWFSTYQFAVAFLKHAEESRPVLHIVNAPKAGPLQFIAYNDVCYSTSEVRPSKIYLQYIQQWSLLLVASANCVDISFLRITKPGDIPEWTQEFANDQFPAELPLTPEKEESFPVGFELDTACSGRLLQEDGSQYPVMPMIHLLSTYGVLCSFYFVNTTPNYIDICSPARPIDPRAQSFFTTNIIKPSQNIASKEDPKTPPKSILSTPLSQSTPAATFAKNNLFSGFGTNTQAVPNTNISAPSTQQNAFSGFSLPTTIQQQTQQPQQQQQQQTQKPTESIKLNQAQPNNQPLITIPPTYNPPATQTKTDSKENSSNTLKINDKEEEQVYVKMIQDEMKAFELELSFIMEKSRAVKVNIGTKEESAEMRRQLEELDELKKEATETVDSLRTDVQTNRLVLTELFSMAYEAKSKCDQAKDEKSLIMTPTHDRTSKRTLEKLKKMITNCEMQVQISVQLLSSQWANYQETLNKNKKNKMHIPSLEGVYQTLTKQQEIIYNLNGKLKMLKTKLGIYDDTKKQKNANVNATIESLSDSIISMSLIDQVQNEKSKLTDKKLKNLRNYLESREVVTIKPQRPQLPGLNSEIIIEKKMKAMKSIKKPEPKKQEVKTAPPPSKNAQLATSNQSVQNIPAPIQTVSKAQPSESVFNLSQKASPFTAMPNTSAANAPIQLSFGKKSDEQSKSFSFGQTTSTTQPFALNLSGSAGSSIPQPSFGFSTTDKKKEEIALPKVQTTQKAPEVKTPSTISNANVSVSANFSLSLPSKTTLVAPKETQKVEEKKPEEIKTSLPTTNESTTFTFSLSGKKDTSNKPSAQATAISFGPNTSNVSDTIKNAFSFGATQSPSATAFSFSNFGKTDVKASSVTSSSAPSISFGNTTSAPFSGFSVSTSESNKPVASTANIFGSALSTSKPVEENKNSVPATKSTVSSSIVTTACSTGFSFATLTGNPTDSKSLPFSFASFGSSITSAAPSLSPTVTTQSTNIFGAKPANVATTSLTSSFASSVPIISSAVSSTSTTDSVLSGLKICSPEVSKPQVTQVATTSPFGSSNVLTQQTIQSPNQSIFGSSLIKPTTPSTSLSSPTSQSAVTITTVQSSTPSSIFGSQTTTQASSIFGSLSLDANKTQSPTTASVTSPSSNIFGSTLVKPDQSVFGQSATTSATGFGNIFSNAASTTSPTQQTAASGFGSIFGGSQASNTSNSNIFGAASPSPSTNIFAQANQTQQPSSGSIFGQVSTANTSGSLFSQSSFSSPSTGSNIFGGGSSTTQTQSPFGSTSIFGSSNTQQPSSSIFGGSSFGSQPSSNIFGASSTTSAQTGNIFGSSNIFAQQSPQNQTQPTFGGNATFSNTFGSSSIFGQQQNQPIFGGTATFGGPKTNIFAASSPQQTGSGQTGNIFEKLGSQQSGGGLFGGLSSQQQQPQQQQSGFSGSAFSSWR